MPQKQNLNILLQSLDKKSTCADQVQAVLWHALRFKQKPELEIDIIIDNLTEAGFSKPNKSRLKKQLLKCKYVVKGSKPNKLKLNVKYISELDRLYSSITPYIPKNIKEEFLDNDLFRLAPSYIKKIVSEINYCHCYKFSNACAVMIRRLIESLLIELFIYKKLAKEIQQNSGFVNLSMIIKAIQPNNKKLTLGKGIDKKINPIKDLGDKAAHSRKGLISIQMIDHEKGNIALLFSELMNHLERHDWD